LDFVKLPSVIGGSLDIVRGYINLKKDFMVMDYLVNVELDLLVLVQRKLIAGESEEEYAFLPHLRVRVRD